MTRIEVHVSLMCELVSDRSNKKMQVFNVSEKMIFIIPLTLLHIHFSF